MKQPPLIAQWEFWPATLEQAQERATVVVLARVTGVESPPEGARRTSFGSRRITLEVLRPLQGAPDQAIRLFWGWTEEQYDKNDPPYRPCEEYVLFLEPKADEKDTHLVISPLGRHRVEEGKLRPVAKQAGGIPVPSWVGELRGKSVGYLEKQLSKAREAAPPATAEDMTDFGTSEVQVDGQVNEPERRTDFVRAYRNGKPALWGLVFYTQEGDPVSFELRYAGKNKEVVLIADSTQDKYGSSRVKEYECGQLVQEGETLWLLQCAGDGQTRDIQLPWERR